MNIEITINENNTSFKLSGRLDAESAPVLEGKLIPALDRSNTIKLDFCGIDYVSSAGLRVLLAGDKKAKADGGKLIFANVSPDVMEVMDLTGFSNVFRFE